jgi:hypothetical protein
LGRRVENMTSNSNFSRWAVVVSGLFGAACSASQPQDEQVGEAQQALTATQERVLGFETPSADWSSSRPISSSSTVSQGSAALAITPNGYVEVSSVALSSLGPVKSRVGFDVRLPQTLAWGEARLVISIPSKGLSWTDVGGVPLSGVPAGSYRPLTFSLPSNVETALEGTYSDLRLRVVLNTPSTSSTILLDHFDIADTGGSPLPPPATTLVFSYPKGQSLSSVFMSASDRLQIDDRVTLAQAGQLPVVAGLGSSGVEVGSGAGVHSNVYSGSSAFLRASSHIYGFVKAAGGVTKQQTDVVVDGGITQNTPVPVTTTSINLTFPPAGPGKVIGPDGPIVLGRWRARHDGSLRDAGPRRHVEQQQLQQQCRLHLRGAKRPGRRSKGSSPRSRLRHSGHVVRRRDARQLPGQRRRPVRQPR